MLNISKTIENGSAVLQLEGRLDTATSPQLEEDLKGVLEQAKNITMDFANLEYISSAGLRVLLSTQKAVMNDGGMKVINVNDTIMEIFEVTGFSDILTIE